MRILYLFLAFIFCSGQAFSGILTVGNNGDGYMYSNIQEAAQDAVPGDTIMMFAGEYSGGQYIEELYGTEEAPIVIMPHGNDEVLVRGGGEAWHLINVAYIYIIGIEFEGQTSNGVNIDDGSDYSTPSHDIVIDNCTWRSMNASGNNDELKMSGINHFVVKNCTFTNGSAGGSLVDMVGCHNGTFMNNHFEDAGSNCIQAKGGTENITIEHNIFINGGYRSINIGGSTGAEFFRPLNAEFESARIQVFSNVFFGSEAPFAFVGTVHSEVVNNTVIAPEKWAIRILQENTDKLQCGYNHFINNIVYMGNASVSPVINIGPNTLSETFVFSNNLWYNYENPGWNSISLPSEETDGIIAEDPLFENIDGGDFSLQAESPAIGNGLSLAGIRESSVNLDYNGNKYNDAPSIGAVEGNPLPDAVEEITIGNNKLQIYPNPIKENSVISLELPEASKVNIRIFDISGNVIAEGEYECAGGKNIIPVGSLTKGLPSGLYIINAKSDRASFVEMIRVLE